jgi:hypothetical protein
MNVGKAIKDENGGGETSQLPRVATNTKQRAREEQRLRVGAGQQAKFPKEPPGHQTYLTKIEPPHGTLLKQAQRTEKKY